MSGITTALLWLLRIAGLLQLALGLLFWINIARNLLMVHMLIGMLLTLALLVLVGLGAAARVAPGVLALTFIWSLILPALGIFQTRLLPGSLHWIIQALHLIVGFAAIGIGSALAQRILAARPAAPAAERVRG